MPRPTFRLGSIPIRLIEILGFLALAILAGSARSANPVFLGRYSRSMFIYQIFNLMTLAVLLAPTNWRKVRWFGHFLVIVSTFLITSNETIADLHGLTLFLPLIRLIAGLAVIGTEFDRYRQRQGVAGIAMSLGLAAVTLSLLDIGLWIGIYSSRRIEPNFSGFRDDYDLRRITSDDIVLVGDSFVWGDGVAAEERFGNVLQRLYADAGKKKQVFSLGVRGAGPSRYLETLAMVPDSVKAGLVIFSFFPNDIEPRPESPLKKQGSDRLWTLARSSLTFRVFLELRAKRAIPDVDFYHASVVDDYRSDDPSFEKRWSDLLAKMKRFETEARQKSVRPPLFLIIPLMVDFRTYPLNEMHRSLGRAAESMGYEVIDLLPEFETVLKDGKAFRVSPGNDHFDARVHALVAELIKRRLDSNSLAVEAALPVPKP